MITAQPNRTRKSRNSWNKERDPKGHKAKRQAQKRARRLCRRAIVAKAKSRAKAKRLH